MGLTNPVLAIEDRLEALIWENSQTLADTIYWHYIIKGFLYDSLDWIEPVDNIILSVKTRASLQLNPYLE